MMNNFPYFEKADVVGFTRAELDAVADLVNTPGWATVKKYLGAIMGPIRPAVYTNTDPERQLMLHQGLGAIYVASNLEEFVSSAKSKADLLVQQEASAREDAEQANPDEV
jgi:hypothetical protein